MPAVIDVFPGVARGWDFAEHVRRGYGGGTDVKATAGAQVKAPASGKAVSSTYTSALDGRVHSLVQITLADGRKVVMLELAPRSRGVWDANQGDVIGYVSTTLWPHFHGCNAGSLAHVPIESFYTAPAGGAGEPITPTPTTSGDDMTQWAYNAAVNGGSVIGYRGGYVCAFPVDYWNEHQEALGLPHTLPPTLKNDFLPSFLLLEAGMPKGTPLPFFTPWVQPPFDAAALMKQITATIEAEMKDVDIDETAIAQALAPQFAQVNANIDDQPTTFTLKPA